MIRRPEETKDLGLPVNEEDSGRSKGSRRVRERPGIPVEVRASSVDVQGLKTIGVRYTTSLKQVVDKPPVQTDFFRYNM